MSEYGQVLRTPMANPGNLAYCRKEYRNFGSLHYTGTKHFYAKNQFDLESTILWWESIYDDRTTDNGDEEDYEADE